MENGSGGVMSDLVFTGGVCLLCFISLFEYRINMILSTEIRYLGR